MTLLKWILPPNKSKNPTITLDQIFLGMNDINILKSDNKNQLDDDDYDDEHYYDISVPIISESTYKEIVQYLSNNFIHNDNHHNNNVECFKHLKFNKQKMTLKKVDMKKLSRFSLTICPLCNFSNCVECTKKKIKQHMVKHNETFKNLLKKKKKKNLSFPLYIICFKCENLFSTCKKRILLDCLGYECVTCEKKYANIYKEFLTYHKNNKNNNNNDELTTYPLRILFNIHYKDNSKRNYLLHKRKIKYIYENYMSEKVKSELGNDHQTLYYHIKIKKKDGHITIIPPLAFLASMRKPIGFYMKLLNNNNNDSNNNHLDIKTQYGSVNSRATGGRDSMYRNMCLNKRHIISARLVIVPCQSLLPHECILPISVYKHLNCPKHVICHRYPTLDIKSMTYHTVIGTWLKDVLGISTAIVSGNNADFDGDCIHVIPATNLPSQAELLFLCHPKRNMIVQNQLRVTFDHDEIETLYSQFGINRSQIHDLIYNVAASSSSSVSAYELFCALKKYCQWVWQFQGIATITFDDYLEIIEKAGGGGVMKYKEFANDIFLNQISENNGIKCLIQSKASRFTLSHLWQMFGYINEEANDKGGFLLGMSKPSFVRMSKMCRLAMIKDIAYYGYTQIKLSHCTKTIIIGYDLRLYTTDKMLVSLNVNDIV